MYVTSRHLTSIIIAAAGALLASGTHADDRKPTTPAIAAPGVPPVPTVAAAAACKNFGIGPFRYTRFERTNGATIHDVPLDLTVSACLDGSSVYTDSLHVSARFMGSAKDLQKTVDDVTRVSCPAKIPTNARSRDDEKPEFAYDLSNVTLQSDPVPQDKQQHAILHASIGATPCSDFAYKLMGIPINLNLTHTVFHIDVILPLMVTSKAPSISFGDPDVTFVNTSHIGPDTSRTERIWASFDADKIKNLESFIAHEVKDKIRQSLDPAAPGNADLKTYLHPGNNIPKDKLASFEIRNARITTINGVMTFDVSVTGEIPRPLLESYIKSGLDQTGLK